MTNELNMEFGWGVKFNLDGRDLTSILCMNSARSTDYQIETAAKAIKAADKEIVLATRTGHPYNNVGHQLRLWHSAPGGGVRFNHVDSCGEGLIFSATSKYEQVIDDLFRGLDLDIFKGNRIRLDNGVELYTGKDTKLKITCHNDKIACYDRGYFLDITKK